MSETGKKKLLIAWIPGAILIGSIIGLLFESWIIGIIATIVLYAILISPSDDKPKKQADASTPTEVQYRPDGTGKRTLRDTEYFCKIAGARHHNNRKGGFLGYVHFDPTNPYDANAIAIKDSKGKLVGYIPRDEQRYYKAFTDRDYLLCIGYITTGYRGDLDGKVKVIDADRTISEIHVLKFTLWLINHYGLQYIPDELYNEFSATVRTEEQWINHIYNLLDELTEERKRADKARKKAEKEAATETEETPIGITDNDEEPTQEIIDIIRKPTDSLPN